MYVNAKNAICVDKIILENFSRNDLLENINIILNFIKKRRSKQLSRRLVKHVK